MKKTRCVLLCVLALALLLSGCSGTASKNEHRGKSYFTYFDTVSYVFSYAGDSAEQFEQRSAEVSGILEEYHKLFDIYHEYSGINNLCTINRLAGGEPVPVDEKLIDFLNYAKELYDKTNGEMNVMLGAVLSIWHDCRTAAGDDPAAARVPSEEELAAAAEHTDISLLEIDEANGTVRLADPEASIDVGAVGKGYATEKAAAHLAEIGAYGYALNVGGNIRTVGTKPDGSGWVTGIRDPFDSDGNFALSLTLSDTACVTSGSYERYYTV
ncbi:MAG: FAD:protein FMN transferase, partial [Clostridiales bacterium]|nr:FAD:protein FMN transferase [Clostridiales bacterium]